MPRLFKVRFCLVASCVLSIPLVARADEPTAAELLPASTVFYAEIAAPAQLIDTIRNHRVGQLLKSLPEYDEYVTNNPGYRQAKAGVAILEIVVGRPWHEAIRDLTGAGLALAIDAKTKGAVVLAHAPDEQKLSELRDRLLQAARSDAKRKGNDDPIVEDEYRGHKVYKADKAIIGTFGKWLIATNNAELGRAVVDNLLDDSSEGVLTAKPEFNAARTAADKEQAAWLYLDVKKIRETGLAEQFYRQKSDNPLLEFLVGGFLSSLKVADTVTLDLYVEDSRLRLSLKVPHDPGAIADEKQFYFGSDGQGVAPVALSPRNQLMGMTSFRDISEMWLRRADLFDENATAQLAQADANLSTIFAGLDFGREVLGGLKPGVQIISTSQSFADDDVPDPKIKLPAAALVFELKDPQKMQRQLKVSFQSLIGLTNLGAGQNDLPQLELTTEQSDSGQLVSASYGTGAADIEVSNDIIYNFSPSLGFVGDHFIISSTRELAEELMGLASGDVPPRPVADRVVNTGITIDSQVLRSILEVNREALIAQNMLEKGHSLQEAEKEIGGLLALLKLLRETTLELGTSDDTLILEVAIGLAVDR